MVVLPRSQERRYGDIVHSIGSGSGIWTRSTVSRLTLSLGPSYRDSGPDLSWGISTIGADDKRPGQERTPKRLLPAATLKHHQMTRLTKNPPIGHYISYS